MEIPRKSTKVDQQNRSPGLGTIRVLLGQKAGMLINNRRRSVGETFVLGLSIPEVHKFSYRCGFVHGSYQKFRLRCFAYATTGLPTSKLSSSFRVREGKACLDDLAHFTLDLAAMAVPATEFSTQSSPNKVRRLSLLQRPCVCSTQLPMSIV
jgi:hypothetical protein